jgi:hypothetical protein
LIKNGYLIKYQPGALQYHGGEPKTLIDELKRSWWFGIRAHKYYKKYPGEFPYARFIMFSGLTLSILLPYVFMILMSGMFALLFIRFIAMRLKPLYAAAESVLSILRYWVFYIAYISSTIDKQRRR